MSHAVVVLLIVGGAFCERDPTYTAQYDYIDVDIVLGNSRLYNRYFDCLMGRSKCSPDAKEIRDNLPEALLTNCEKCTEKQRKESRRVISFLIREKPEDFKLLEGKYDPAGVYRRRYNAGKSEKPPQHFVT